MAIKNLPIIGKYGTLWARNSQNINTLRKAGKLYGVYILRDGSMPVYVGRGRLFKRICAHQRSKSRGQFWDHFSWFAIPDRRLEAEVEALLLRTLPFYLRSLNKQRTRFTGAHRIVEENPKPDAIKRPNFLGKRRRR
jgi:hypothetical protein